QFGGDFTPDYVQNGYPTGEYSSLTFASDGSIVASYTNGEVMKTGTLTLAHFNNLQGLKPVGGNAWIETAESGPAILGTPGSMGFATIEGQAVEESNVDIGTELVNMIITQRVYQANAQTITTQSEMMQTLINIRECAESPASSVRRPGALAGFWNTRASPAITSRMPAQQASARNWLSTAPFRCKGITPCRRASARQRPAQSAAFSRVAWRKPATRSILPYAATAGSRCRHRKARPIPARASVR